MTTVYKEKKRTHDANSGSLLTRILEEPGLLSVVPYLDASTLLNLITHLGLEDSGEILSIATAQQLQKIFDLDLWHHEKPGKIETFSSDRFVIWLEILLEIGVEAAAQKIVEMDEDFLVMAFNQSILVLTLDGMALQCLRSSGQCQMDPDLLAKALDSGLNQEFERFRIISKKQGSWAVFCILLLELGKQYPDFLRIILERCCSLSTEYIEDNGGLYRILTADQRLETDVAEVRKQRREQEGYVSALTAVSFLSLIRISHLEEIMTSRHYDRVTQSYFKDFIPPSPFGLKSRNDSHKKQEPIKSLSQTVPAELLQNKNRLVALLQEAGVMTAQKNVFLLEEIQDHAQTQDSDQPSMWIRPALLTLRDTDPQIYADRMIELNYLSNVLISGCSDAGKIFNPVKAAAASLATCNLGLEFLQQAHKMNSSSVIEVLKTQNLIKVFRMGWFILFQNVSLFVAHHLIRYLSNDLIEIAPRDAWNQRQIKKLCRTLKTHVSHGKPWEIREKIDILEIMMDPPVIDTLKHLLDECPTFSDNRTPIQQTQKLHLKPAFIFSQAQVKKIYAFLEQAMPVKNA